MPLVQSFAPISNEDSERLILGSLPGIVSLHKGEYYGHPQNTFWRILGQILEFDPKISYHEKIAKLLQSKIALWDVIATCVREGSADSEIDAETIVVNDFQSFFDRHPKIQRLFFNGAKAEACFKRYVLDLIHLPPLLYTRLPSTSPAYASLSFEKKQILWRQITEHPSK